MTNQLPPGPRIPGVLQTVLFLKWPYWFVDACQRRYGDVFTLRLTAPGEEVPGAIVYLADPAAIRELFSHDGREGHAGAANAVLEPLTGPHSILLLDREEHLRERRLLSPAFHGDALPRLETIIREATERELAAWPDDSVFAVRPAMQRITFEVIVRAVLGVEDRKLQERLLEAFEPLFNFSVTQIMSLVRVFRVDLGRWSPWGRFRRDLDRLDELLLNLISERRGSAQRDDILGMLLSATDEEGNGLSDTHVRDELVTLLLAGHETTATALAWAFERLAHHPLVTAGLRQELAAGESGAADAIAAETLRVRPVVMDVARLLSADIEIGGFDLPVGTTVMPGIYLVHFDEKNHEKPQEFRPERFRDAPPSAATWLPFGGGRRRCVGAAFAQMELRLVLEMALANFVPEPVSRQAERSVLRGITFVPEHGARLRMRRRPLSQPLAGGPSGSSSYSTQVLRSAPVES